MVHLWFDFGGDDWFGIQRDPVSARFPGMVGLVDAEIVGRGDPSPGLETYGKRLRRYRISS